MDRINTQDKNSERNTILVVQHWLLHFYSVYTQVLHFFWFSPGGYIFESTTCSFCDKHLKLKLVHF